MEQGLPIRDIAPLIHALPEEVRMQRLLMAALLAALVVALIVFWIIRRLRPAPPVPPHISALNALSGLPADPVLRTHQLNLILRRYLAARFAVPATGKTAAETLVLLEKHQNIGLTPPLLEFIEQSDPLRFSNRIPEGYAAAAEELIRRYVEQTCEEEEPCD